MTKIIRHINCYVVWARDNLRVQKHKVWDRISSNTRRYLLFLCSLWDREPFSVDYVEFADPANYPCSSVGCLQFGPREWTKAVDEEVLVQVDGGDQCVEFKLFSGL